jgi:hypothetical protein
LDQIFERILDEEVEAIDPDLVAFDASKQQDNEEMDLITTGTHHQD